MRTLLAALLFTTTLAAQPALFEPSLSPDGKTVAFVSGGDIWTAPAGGGEARLLVAHPAYDSRPLFSPDGKSLAFISMRTGNGDIYIADLTTSQVRRLTYDDGRDSLDAWSRDGKWIYFSSTGRSADTLANDIYRVAASGGTPMMITDERMHNHYHAAPSPDGKSLALVGYGSVSAQWWRHGRSHMDETQLWLMNLGSAVARSRGSSAENAAQPSDRATAQPNQYRQLAGDGAKQVWPMWTPDGTRLFYMSDRDGNENIWTMPVASADAKQVTSFHDGRVLWPSIAYDGSAIVFERNFGIWRLDPASGQASAIPITLRGIAGTPAIEHRNVSDRFREFELSPDGKKFAFVARGDVFAAPTKDTGSAARVTNTPSAELHVTWSPDSKSLVYVSDRGGTPHLYRYDFASEKETQLTSGDGSDLVPRFSPDGKLLAFQRNHRELDVLDLGTNQVQTIASGHFDPAPYVSTLNYDFSPDSKWIAFLDYDATLFANAFVVPVAGGTPRAVSFLSNTNTDSLVWSRDGKFLLMATGQRTETARIARIDLVPVTPKFREEQFRELFQPKPSEEKAAAAVKPEEKEKKTPAVEIEFAGIRDRVQLIPVGHDVNEVAVSPDGKWIAYAGDIGGDQQVYVYSIDELADDPAAPKQLSSSSGGKRALTFTPDSKEVWYLDNNKVAAATIDPAKARNVGVTAEMDIDFAREKQEAFAQMYTYLRDNFFDANMNGVDWKAWRDRLTPYVDAARNGDEFRRLLGLMIGELNASHTGANSSDAASLNGGRLGVRYDRDEYESRGALKVRDVIPLSPADVAKIRTGEYVVAIDGKPASGSTNIDALLEYKSGKRTVVSVASSADGASKRDVIVQPIDATAERRLTYAAWVNASRDYVHRISNGKLGYVHMYSMSFDSLQKLYLDLDAENRSHQGIVIDLRNNHGGFVNVYAMDVFARRSYFTMTPRDFDTPSGARTVLGQRALEKPTVLVINRHTLSDGEDFTEGYRTLKLGKVVGEPTAGWIIYTSDYTLIDGTSLRLPSVRIRDTRGQDMEMHPRPVDRFVARPLGETAAGKDTQLDAAVEELLKDLK